MIKHLNFSNQKNNSKFFDNIFYIISPLLFIGFYLGYTSYIICLLFIFLRLFSTNKETAGVFLVLFGGLIGGVTRHVYPAIPIYGSLIILIGLVLLSRNIGLFFKSANKSIIYLLIVFFIFFISYLYGPQHLYSNSKLLAIVINGFLFLFIYSIINISKKFSNVDISQLLLLTSISLFVASIQSYGYSSPNSFFDYSWFRKVTDEIIYDYNADSISYQAIGMNTLYAFAFFVSSKKMSFGKYKIFHFLFYATCLQLILLSGARQAIFGLFLVAFIRIAFFSNANSSFKKLFFFLLGIIVLFVLVKLIGFLNIDFLSAVIDSQGDIDSITGRGDNIDRALKIIQESPLFGVGLGGYSPEYMSIYPHNIFLEILSECGIIGLTVLLALLFYFYISNRHSIKQPTNKGLYVIIILASLFVRASVSSDLTESIALFSGIFAMSVSRKKTSNA